MQQVKQPQNPLSILSGEEKKILSLVAEGKTIKEIGATLNLGEKTVRNYLSTVMTKLNVSRRAEAASIHVRHFPSLDEKH